MNLLSDYEHHKRDEEWAAAEDRRLARELEAVFAHERRTTGVDRRLPIERDVTDVSQWED